jgi:hypothetical protein
MQKPIWEHYSILHGCNRKATQNLIEKIKHLCPNCSTPGFDIVTAQAGLPCENCSLPTRSTLSYLYQCKKCIPKINCIHVEFNLKILPIATIVILNLWYTLQPILKAKQIENEELVAIPTETVYGLAGNIYSESHSKKYLKQKKPLFNP